LIVVMVKIMGGRRIRRDSRRTDVGIRSRDISDHLFHSNQ
jgi:hypothetical protein